MYLFYVRDISDIRHIEEFMKGNQNDLQDNYGFSNRN